MNTLVLNASYEIMKIVSWKKAVVWFFLDKIDIIEEYEQNIPTPSIKMKIPSVVKYKKLIRQKNRLVKFSRTNVHLRDNFTCQYCSKQVQPKELTVDHILPRSKGGISSWLNCVACCIDCNVRKGNKTLREAGIKLLREPYQPESFIQTKINLAKMPDAWKNYSF